MSVTETCAEEVADSEGYAVPCERQIVGWRVDPEENEPYPVCATHHRWPYADEWVGLRVKHAEVSAKYDRLAAAVERVRDLIDTYPWMVDVGDLSAALDGDGDGGGVPRDREAAVRGRRRDP